MKERKVFGGEKEWKKNQVKIMFRNLCVCLARVNNMIFDQWYVKMRAIRKLKPSQRFVWQTQAIGVTVLKMRTKKNALRSFSVSLSSSVWISVNAIP